MQNMALALFMVALSNDKARVFGRIKLDEVVKDDTRFRARVRINETLYLEGVPVTKQELDGLRAKNKVLGMIELSKPLLQKFLKNAPEGTEIGANVSKSGHVYIKGIDSTKAIELGEMPPRPVKVDDPGFGGAPAAAPTALQA